MVLAARTIRVAAAAAADADLARPHSSTCGRPPMWSPGPLDIDVDVHSSALDQFLGPPPDAWAAAKAPSDPRPSLGSPLSVAALRLPVRASANRDWHLGDWLDMDDQVDIRVDRWGVDGHMDSGRVDDSRTAAISPLGRTKDAADASIHTADEAADEAADGLDAATDAGVAAALVADMDAEFAVKLEPLDDAEDLEDAADERSREFNRQRQRLYEKKYRQRKRVRPHTSTKILCGRLLTARPHAQVELMDLRRQWLALEARLFVVRRAHRSDAVVLQPSVTRPQSPRELRSQLQTLVKLERAMLLDRVAMATARALERVARIREYSDKNALRSSREWTHSTAKIFGGSTLHQPLVPLSFHW